MNEEIPNVGVGKRELILCIETPEMITWSCSAMWEESIGREKLFVKELLGSENVPWRESFMKNSQKLLIKAL